MITPVKLHLNLVKTVAAGARQIFGQGAMAEQVVDRLQSSDRRFGARDRRFIAEALYSMVRYQRRWQALCEHWQVPAEDYVAQVVVWLAVNGLIAEDWTEYQHLPLATATQVIEQLNLDRAAYESIPDWLDYWASQSIGERWDQELHALNEQAPTYIRANTLKTDRDELREILASEQIETELVPWAPDALQLVGRVNVLRLGSFRKGLYEVQDASSQAIAPFALVKPGMRVIDACAGAGGKTLHLAALMQNQGEIVSMDVEGWKLEELKKRAKRNGVNITKTHLIEDGRSLKQFSGTADALLLDAPCTGIGVLRRHPGAKMRLTEEMVEDILDTQEHILDKYPRMLKVGGTLVYATCSLMPEENEKQVERFLAKNKSEFEFEADHRTWPSEGRDGFFMARFKKVK